MPIYLGIHWPPVVVAVHSTIIIELSGWGPSSLILARYPTLSMLGVHVPFWHIYTMSVV